MATIEDQITKAAERLAALQAKAKEDAKAAKEATAKGPSARSMNQLAREIRSIDRIVAMLIEHKDEQIANAVIDGLRHFMHDKLRDWTKGYKSKWRYCQNVGDVAELEKLDSPLKLIEAYGLDVD